MPRRQRGKRSKNDSRRSSQTGERREKHYFALESGSRNKPEPQTAQQIKQLERLLSGIGVPEAAAFKPDPFQLEALASIENEDVLVTAPTGSGKTWIAREEIRRLLSSGRRAWYTTPLKALTNSKYAEFVDLFGPDNVGILTGDRKENTDAPVLVGTTEIYRNQLFDALREGFDVKADLVVLDEAHYLSDPDRGHVWEESIILSPARIRLLLLSATVGRAGDLAKWIEDVRGTRVRVVSGGPRPVELRAAYLSGHLQLFPLIGYDRNLNRDLEQFARNPRSGFRRRSR